MVARPGDMSRRITEGREAAGLGAREAADRLGVSPRQLRAWERGEPGIPRAVRTAMAALYGLPLTDLVPPRADVAFDGGGTISIGSVSFSVRGATDSSLREFLTAVRSQRNLAGDTEVPVRADEAVVLAGVLGGTPEAIVARIRQLLDVTDDEAQELSAWIWRRRAVAGAVTAGALAFSAGAVLDNAAANPVAAPATASVPAADARVVQALPIARTSPAPPAAPAATVVDAVAKGAHPSAPAGDASHDAHLDQVAALETRLAEQQAKIVEQEGLLAEQAALIATITGQLADNDIMLADRSRQTGDQQATIDQQASVIAGLTAELAARGEIIAELNRQLAEQGATAKGTAAVAEAQAAQTIAGQAAMIAALKREAGTTRLQLEIAVAELEAMAKELAGRKDVEEKPASVR